MELTTKLNVPDVAVATLVGMVIFTVFVRNVIVALVIAVVVYTSYMNLRKYRGLPPGPLALPLVGNMLNIGPDPRVGLKTLGQIYGEVFSIYLGSTLVVVLNSYTAIREAFVQNGASFNHRPHFFFQTIWKNKGIATVNGDLWREQKRFLLKGFNNIGMKQRIFQNSIEKEARELVQAFIDRSQRGTVSQNPMDVIVAAICNVTCSFLWSSRHDYNELETERKLQRMKENFELVGGTEILNIYPALKYLPGDYFNYRKFIKNIETDIAINQKCIEEHRKSRTPGKPRDFIDAFLEEAEMQSANKNTSFTDEQLHRVLLDIFGAGTQSPAATLLWTQVYMLHYPQVLSNVREEIHSAIGNRKYITVEDRPKIPYTEATLLEVMRIADVTPLGIPHATSEPVCFRGYQIPEKTWVISNLHAVCRDPGLWREPDRFNPDRFLEVEKDHVTLRTDYFVPFSIGRRSCPGESLARVELLVFFGNIVHNIDFSVSQGCDLPGLEGHLSTVYMPPDMQLVAQDRWSQKTNDHAIDGHL